MRLTAAISANVSTKPTKKRRRIPPYRTMLKVVSASPRSGNSRLTSHVAVLLPRGAPRLLGRFEEMEIQMS